MISPAPIGDALARSLVLALRTDCQTAAIVARAIVGRQAAVVDLRNLTTPSAGSLKRVTDDFVGRGWLSPVDGAWSVGPNQIPMGLASFLEGAAAMSAILPDDGRATAVVTMPRAPSAIGLALPGTGLAHAALVATQETFEKVADTAITSLTVMTPFLNHDGLVIALDLFRRTRASRRHLIIRRTGGARAAIEGSWSEVAALGIDVLDYTLPAVGGYETFHAKVLLADQDLAYVGSANMTAFARHSMELGILTDGRAARIIANVVRAIERIAVRIPSSVGEHRQGSPS